LNFVGKFDAKLHVDGSGAHPDVHHHVDSISAHAPSDAIIVPDADLLFNGDFRRSGVDLILSRDDREWAVEDYFKGEKRVALASPDGAHLTGDIINALAGHVQYAQADGSAGAGKVIGHVTKLTGTATAIRNGVSIILNHGDNVEKGDVVQSGSGSTLGVTFIDGTVFGLSANARMVLNEMIYDPNGSDNSTLISLVSGTISFVAGQTAKHGDMKIDTPVATMGIRGTAVLVEIDFDVPGQNGMPEGRFQVVMEPNGILGSYILYEKNTLAPIAIVDKAGQRVDVSNNHVSFSDSPLTPELQKLISEVFTLKFSTNPQTFTHFTDTLIPQETWLPVQFANGAPPVAVHVTIAPFVLLSASSSSAPAGGSPIPHINQPPVVITADSSLAEHAGVTGSSGIDTTSGTISFADINLGDRPTAKATISSFSYQNAQHQDISASAQELADIQALENIPLVVVQAPGNTYNGTATWTLNVPDKAFDFLGAGDTLRLTYMAEVDSNYGGGNLPGFAPFTITVTGTNDAPVITTGAENVAFVSVGTGTTGPNLPPTGPTSNKLTFKDPDLTDTHTVSAHLTAATLSGNDVATLDMQALETKFPRPMGVFESALSAAMTTDSTGTGAGTITWTLADIAAYYADIVPDKETLTLTYTVTVKDLQGATSSQNVIVTITGSAPPAVVWVETTADAATDPGDWSGKDNWETGTVPTASDDVIIITDQLQGPTPFYPVTINAAADPAVAAAFANSVTMDNFDDLANAPGATAPELDVGRVLTLADAGVTNGSLAIGTDISLNADAILKVFGTLSVGTIAKILGSSVLDNSGIITLGQGGQFGGSSSITNSGTIEVVSDELDVQVDIANTGGILQIDNGATLKLSSATAASTTITGGNLTLGSGSTLDVESTGGATLDGVTVTGTDGATPALASTIAVGAHTVSGAILTLDDGTTIINGTLNIAAGSTLDIEKGTTGPGATLDGVTVIGSGITSAIDVGTTAPGATVALLDDGTSIKNVTLNIAAGSTLDIEKGATGPGATLDGVTVVGSGTTSAIDVGTTASGATLTLDDATSITSSQLVFGGSSDRIFVGSGGATLDDVTVSGGGETDIGSATVTGVTLTLDGATIIGGTINDGTSTAGGIINVTANSTIEGVVNAGVTTNASLSNGAVNIAAATTLKLDNVTVTNTAFNDTANATTSIIQIDGGDTLQLQGGSSVTGGSLVNDGTLQIESGATLDGVIVSGGGAINVDFTGSPTPATLTLEGGTSITGGTLKIGSVGTLDVESTGGATLNGVAVTGTTAGPATSTITIGATTASGSILTLDNGASITGSKVTFTAGSDKVFVGAGGATLDDVAVTGGGETDIGSAMATGVTLTLTDGTTVTDGSLDIATGGEVYIQNGSGTVGATLDHVTVTGGGEIEIGNATSSGSTLILSDGTTISGVTLTLDDATDVVDIEAGTNGTGITLTGMKVSSSGTLSISDDATLTLSGATIDGGAINDGTSSAGGIVNVVADSTIEGVVNAGVTTDASLNNGVVNIDAGTTLTLDNVRVTGTTINGTDTTSIIQVDGDTTLKLSGATIDGVTINDFSTVSGSNTAGDIEVTGPSTISNASLNGGAVTVDNGAMLTLTKVTVAGSTITDVKAADSQEGTLILDGVTVIGGTINDGTSSAGGIVNVIANSTIEGVVNAGVTINASLNNGVVNIAAGITLTLDNVTVTGTTFTDTASGAAIQVDDGTTLTLSGVTIDSGTINDGTADGTVLVPGNPAVFGSIDVTGDSKIDSGATLNNGAVTVESDVTLTLDGMTVNGTVFNDLVTGGTIQSDSGDALTFNGATINGGTLNISGELDSTGISFITGATIVNSSHIDVVSGTLTIDPAPVTNTGTIEVKGDSTLVLSGETITNSVTTDGVTTKGVIQVDATDSTHFSTLDLHGSTINGGTLIISGELVSTGDSFITGADITNTGTIDVTSGTLTIDATSILNNTGTLETNGGNLIIDAAFSGNLEIKGAAALELGSANAYSQVTVTFEPKATGTLKLDDSKTFSGTVAGLDDNTIDLVDIAYGSNPTVRYAGDASGGILSVFVGGVDVSNIKLTGDYLGVHWTLTDDGSSPHGTDVREVPGAVAGLDSNGNAIQGVAVTASITDGGQTVSGATYDWQVSHDGGKTWVDAHGTNGLSSYTPVEADEGQLLRVALSFTDYSGQPETSFVSAGVVQESLTDDLVATLDHTTAQQGVTMHVLGVKDGGITVTTGLTYAWQDSSDNGLTWVTVGNGTHSSYTPGESDEGKLMQLVVTYADASGSESSTYSLGMPNDLSATLDSTTAQQGLAIHVTAVNDGGTKVSSGVSYAWQVSSDNGTDWITVGTHSSYTPIAADAGETLQVVVTYADSQEKESATYSLGSVAPAKEWLGGNHDWQTAGQWATSGAPASSDNAVIDASGFYTVKIDQAAAAHSLVVNDLGAAVEILAGNTLTLGGNATIEAGILQIDSGATLKDIAASATITGAFIDNGTVEAAGGTLEVASAISFGAGKFTIDAGATLQLDHADTLKVAFSGNGELILKDPTHFTGIISDSGGSLTSADVVDVAGFDTGASVSYFGLKSGGIVTISETGHTAVNLIVGANSTHWSAPVTDGHGGILIHDPPADTSGQALDSVVITDPGPAATSTIVASGPNQILTGNAASDTFAFNFIGVGHTTVTDFHPATDTLQFSNQLFADLQAALNATHDDGHGNTVVALDAHDTITLNGILKAQLHASDFHFV
jgi:fibronectin-binding autotransporter adhesin